MTDEPKVLLQTPWFSVESRHLPITQGGAETSLYYKLNIARGVVILPVTPEGNFILIRQYRPVIDRMTIEIPAGAIDGDETPEQAALREFTEETGYCNKGLLFLGSGVLRIEREDALNSFYIALDVEPQAGQKPEPGIELLEVSPQGFKNIVRDGQFDHIAALPLFTMADFGHNINLFE